MRFTAFLIVLFLASFTGTALAQSAVASADPSVSETIKAVFEAVTQGQWWIAAAYGVILATIAARKVMPASWKEGTKGDIVGVATAFAVAFAGAVATAVPTSGMSLAVVATAAKIGVAAIGGFTVIHKIAGWLAAWGKLPAWALPIVKLLALLVGSKAVAKAEKLGDKAVAKSPPSGIVGNDKIIEVE